ncbi:N-acetyltransferase [Actinoplanes sp. TFC3]|uniref:GNAT family N-acetyltransferase n=1 Tax=Actinoplanes sp. TFC3 TaxID=1710355 RepID=UPI001F178613|nr:GNAT family N-acetyltransferase [Actinoplanes sp. TFC3]
MIRLAHAGERRAVAELIGIAFDDLEQNHALVPDEKDRLPVMTNFFDLASAAATIDIIPGPLGEPAAAAVWFDRTTPETADSSYDRSLAALAGPYLAAFQDLHRILGRHHPLEPHWHLAFLAVHPHHRRAGLGTALLQHRHARLTLPAYLEATNADNIRLYRRLGYHHLTPFKVALPGGTPFYRMWRDA